MTVTLAYPDFLLYAELSAGVWTDITADFLGMGETRAEIHTGMSDNRHTTRVGRVGEFIFYLRNTTYKYSPGNAAALSGWQAGIRVKFVITYDGITHPFIFHIATPDGIELVPGIYGKRQAKVTCLDWMDYADKWPVINPGLLTNKTGGQILTQTLALMTKVPLATSFDMTVETFPTVFDTVTSHTTALEEINKVVYSEVGYGYIKHDLTYGEMLVLESATHRSGLDTETNIPVISALSGRRLREAGGYKLREAGGYKLRDERQTFSGAGISVIAADIPSGTNLINLIRNYGYPRKLDASNTVLFRLSTPIPIQPGQTYTLKGTFADPNGGLPINGQSMVDPAATTDYLFFANSDGTGTNLTANIAITYPSAGHYGTEGFTHYVQNTGATLGYLTQYNTRGIGIYINYNPVQHQAQDSDSISNYGTVSAALHQKYQQNADYGAVFTESWIEQERRPRTRTNSIKFCANSSPAAMQAFLYLDISSMVYFSETVTGVAAYYYIQGRDIEILPGKVIMVTYILKEILNLTLGLSLIGMNMNWPVGAQAAVVDYGALPWLQNLSTQTVVITIYPENASKTLQTLIEIGSIGAGGGEHYFSLDSNNIYYDVRYSGANGEWHATTTTINNSTWYRVAVAWDTLAGTPVIYINGVKQTLTTDLTPSGSVTADVNSPLTIGATQGSTGAYSQYYKGQVFAPLVYNVKLTDAEMAAETANPLVSGVVTRGLVFQGLCVPTKNIGDYQGVLATSDKLRDNIYRVVGTPNNSPVGLMPMLTGRAAPTVVTVSTQTGANVTSATLSHTVSAGNNRAIVVAIQKRGFDDTTSVVRGSQSFTRYSKNYFASGNYPQYEFWELLAPTVGTANIVVTFPSGDWVTVTAIDFINVDQTTPIFDTVYVTGTGTGPALSNAAISGTLLFDILAIEKGVGTTLTATAGQTQRSNITADNNWSSATSTKAGAGITSTGWTVSGSPHNWIYAAISILGAQ